MKNLYSSIMKVAKECKRNPEYSSFIMRVDTTPQYEDQSIFIWFNSDEMLQKIDSAAQAQGGIEIFFDASTGDEKTVVIELFFHDLEDNGGQGDEITSSREEIPYTDETNEEVVLNKVKKVLDNFIKKGYTFWKKGALANKKYYQSKITKIDSILKEIYSLNAEEFKQLNTLLEAPFPKGSEYGKKEIEIINASILALKIEEGKIKETKEILMKQDEDGWSTAHELAIHSGETGWSTKDKEILMMQTDYGYSVAHCLAYNSGETGWSTKDKEILLLKNQAGITVEEALKTS